MSQKTVEQYIAEAPEVAQPKLRELRALLQKVTPSATEAIKWGYPVFETTRILFAYGAFADHLNFMPTPATLEHFKKDLAGFSVGKMSIQLPYDQPLPDALITQIAQYRLKDVQENDARWM